MNFYKRHLGDIAKSWTMFRVLPERERLPRCAGAYAIYFDGRLVYIGQSCDIANRFSEHCFRYGYGRHIVTPWGEVPESTTITVKVKRSRRLGDWAMWEIRLIARLRPVFNSHHKRGRRVA